MFKPVIQTLTDKSTIGSPRKFMEKEKIQIADSRLETANQPLRGEYDEMQSLFNLQPAIIQHFFEGQGRQLADLILQNQNQARFSLPDKVVIEAALNDTAPSLSPVPPEFREQAAGGVIDRLARSDLRTILRQRLGELESSNRKPVSVSARLIRFATAHFMIYSMLPSGKTVQYVAPEGEEIASIPAENPGEMESAITQDSDAIVESGEQENGRGELQVPFVPDARRFFLPQWVAFGRHSNILVNTIGEAEKHIASMQKFLGILHAAVSLAPYFVLDSEYQKKRYGMLGQLVNQGRAMACYQTEEMIAVIKQRAKTHDLNRGLSLTLPFFDDQALEIRTHDFTVIPAGRIMFVPAFVIRATEEELAKVAQDTRLSPSTRKYLLNQLKMLGFAFLSDSTETKE
jgi:hypothetical protein